MDKQNNPNQKNSTRKSDIYVVEASPGPGQMFQLIALLSKMIDDESLLIIEPTVLNGKSFYSEDNSYEIFTDRDMHGIGYSKASFICDMSKKTEKEIISAIEQHDTFLIVDANIFIGSFPAAWSLLMSSNKRCILCLLDAKFLSEKFTLLPISRICGMFRPEELTSDENQLLLFRNHQKYYRLLTQQDGDINNNTVEKSKA
jgi:hypothetical protein